MDWKLFHGRRGLGPAMPHISHKTATAGAKLNNLRSIRLPGNFIHMRQIDAAHFTKQAGYFGGCGEITCGTDRVLPPVIPIFRMAKGKRDKLADGQSASLCNHPMQQGLDGVTG